jgi:hypothetical protein
MSLKQRGSSETEENLRQIIKKVGDHCLRRAPARLPSASSAAQRLLLLPAWFLELRWWRKKQAWIGKGLKAKGSMKSWGHLRFYL